MVPTPANDGVPVEVASLWEEGLHQQGEQVEALNEQPEVVGHHTVVEEHHHSLARHLQTNIKENAHSGKIKCIFIYILSVEKDDQIPNSLVHLVSCQILAPEIVD